MTLSEMRRILTEGDIRLTKSLGQNFLHDGNHLRRIVAAAELTASDPVLEIGPGLGPLTELLVAGNRTVLAIEKDKRLVDFLAGHLQGSPSLTLLHDDALEFLQREPRDWSGWKMVSNLPYSVASPILVELAWSPSPPSRMVTTLQLEASRRLTAQPGTDDYGVLTLLMQLDYELKDWFKIPANCFFPIPDVDSACLILSRRPEALLPQAARATFERVIKTGFSQRRKMLFKLLKAQWPPAQVEAAFTRLGLSPQTRAEQVALAQYVELTHALATDG